MSVYTVVNCAQVPRGRLIPVVWSTLMNIYDRNIQSTKGSLEMDVAHLVRLCMQQMPSHPAKLAPAVNATDILHEKAFTSE